MKTPLDYISVGQIISFQQIESQIILHIYQN